MKLSVKNIFAQINNYYSEVENFINSEEFNVTKCFELLDKYKSLSTFIISHKNIPENVAVFLISDENVEDIVLPLEYVGLKGILSLRNYIRNYYDKLIKTDLKKGAFEQIIENIVYAIRLDIKNVSMFEYIVEHYELNNLDKELIEVYKLLFIYSLNPKYFEKIGDVYFKMKDYNSAIDSYLSCAESSDENVEIYKKLAVVFEKINDNDSRLACLNHIKVIEDLNDK